MTKEQLQELLSTSSVKLDELQSIDYDGLSEHITELTSIFKEFKEGGEELLSSNDTLQIGIVGQVKAGKSSFLNSLFFDGEDVLPKASTPMTAGLTIIEYDENNSFEVEYFNEADWDIFVRQDEEYRNRENEVRKANPGAPEIVIKAGIESVTTEKVRSAHELVSACCAKAKQKIGAKNDVQDFFDIKDLQNVLEQYVGANGEYTSVVKSLYIKMNDERLVGMRIVDTPGVNDPVVSRENRTRTFLHACHGVFLLSSSTDFLGSGDIGFLNSRIGGSGIGTVVLLASKFDSVLQDIGADKEMKGEQQGDLFDVVEMQTKKFKRRLRELSDTIDEKLRGKIKFDTTSGIGYSIAHKESSRWDELEKRIISQMKRFYPDYFSTEADIKESFDGLAKINEIRENYLDGVFMSNNDAIISSRVAEFFNKYGNEVSSEIDSILEQFLNRKQLLEETSIAELEKQKEMQSKLFDALESKFDSIFNNFGGNIQSDVKHLKNTILFHGIKVIPTETILESVTCERDLGFFGNKTIDVNIDHVNTYALCQQIDEAIEQYAKDWNEEWMKLFEKARKNMVEKLNSSISDFEKNVMSSTFDDVYYRNIIDSALDEMRNCKELSIGNIITEYQNQGENIANKQFYAADHTHTYVLKDNEVQTYLRRQLDEHNKKLKSEFQILSESIVDDISTEVSKSLNNAIGTINGIKSSFKTKLKEEGSTYIEGLEKDMEDKTAVLEKIEKIIICMEQLSNLYHK